jgi:competence ComEA-like helix-hairpin-helix protein
MNFNLSETEKKISPSDGRLTVIMALVLLLLLWSLKNQWFAGESVPAGGGNMHLRVEHQGHLLIEPWKNIKESPYPGDIPARYLPFFFQPLPINSAEKELLMTVKGIGPHLAETIVTHRHRVGPIMNINDLQAIPGVGHKRATALATELVFDKIE